MHELSIALSIIDGVEEELASRDGARAEAVYVRLGPLAGVVKDALLSAWELACEGTELAGARLAIEEMPVTIYCPRCASERPAVSVQRLCCAVCETAASDVRGGTELEVFALELAA